MKYFSTQAAELPSLEEYLCTGGSQIVNTRIRTTIYEYGLSSLNSPLFGITHLDIITISCIFLLGGVAQLAEQENHNLCVRGSNPFAAISLMSHVNEYYRETQCITRQVNRVKDLYNRYNTRVNNLTQHLQTFFTLFTRSDELTPSSLIIARNSRVMFRQCK